MIVAFCSCITKVFLVDAAEPTLDPFGTFFIPEGEEVFEMRRFCVPD